MSQPPLSSGSGPPDPERDPDRTPDPPSGPGRRRLDPGRAVAEAEDSIKPAAPAIDTRRYQWTVGLIGIGLVIAFSVYLFTKNGVTPPGIPAGGHLRYFVAPRATGDVNLPANADPRCDPAHANPEGLNVCGRTPLVLAFFVTGSADCIREVDTLQAVSHQFPGVQFAALAVRGSRLGTRALQRSHHWTIPVGFDSDGRVGQLYGVEICPMIELAQPGGRVEQRLIGGRWTDPRRLAGQVGKLLAS